MSSQAEARAGLKKGDKVMALVGGGGYAGKHSLLVSNSLDLHVDVCTLKDWFNLAMVIPVAASPL